MRIIGKTNSNLLFTVWLAMVLVFSTAAQSQTWNGRTVAVNGNTGGFYEYLPTGYNDAANSTKNYPLIVFLHGLGELGNGSTDLPKILNTGLPQYISQGKFPSSFNVGGSNFSFIVICPQFIAWPGAPDVEAVINYAAQKYRVDASRIYVTGLSMGGGATWDYAGSSATAASRIAAIVPICGATWPDINKAKVMANANLPVWATHNDGDGTVAVSNTNGFVDGINSFNPAVKAQKTIWQSWGHDAWTKTYDPAYKLDGVRNTYEWMLLYSRNGATPPPPPPAPSLTAWISKTTDVTCNGSGNGSATVSLSGGVAPYTYSWSTNPVQTGSTATNLAPGSYVVTVKDANNTTATATANISEPTKLQINVAAGTISATGGTTSVTVSAAGGVAPYSFTGPTSNVVAGTYTYKVTDSKGCTDSKTITISEPSALPPPPGSALAISIVGTTNVSCNGGSNGSASVTVSGGVAPYSYNWNSNPVQTGVSAGNLPAGSYTVTVKDAASSSVSTVVTITQPEALLLTANAGKIDSYGGTTSVSLSAQGGVPPYSFEGNTSGLPAGNYSFVVTDAMGCKTSATVTISEPDQIVLKGSHEPIKCNGGRTKVNLTAEGGKAPYVFQGQTTNLTAGTYSFGVTDANGAKGNLTLTITEPSPLVLNASAGTITRIGGMADISLNATGGTSPYSYSGKTSNLKAGTYQYKVSDANGCETTASVELKEPGIKLASFGINTIDTLVRLNWSTSYEYGIEKFEIEKSKEDKVFKSLKQVRSHLTATTNTILTYNSDDESSVKGANSYRLYAVTVFGERILLVERNLFFSDLGSAVVKNLTDRLEINVTSTKEEKVFIILYDAAGRPLKRLQENKNANLFRMTVPMNDLPKGYYVLKLMTGSGLQMSKQVVKP